LGHETRVEYLENIKQQSGGRSKTAVSFLMAVVTVRERCLMCLTGKEILIEIKHKGGRGRENGKVREVTKSTPDEKGSEKQPNMSKYRTAVAKNLTRRSAKDLKRDRIERSHLFFDESSSQYRRKARTTS